MKKRILTILLGLILLSCSKNAKNESTYLDHSEISYVGIYEGILPCADCSGIIIHLEITSEGYTLLSTYIGHDNEPFQKKGRYAVDKNMLILDSDSDSPVKYLIGGNYLKQLDTTGHEIIGHLADKYILKKI